ncbi:MAG: DNA polymerase III subunit gamma/tau [Eubacteriales bacterium]|nr:DNA polymerase III subunit gamma/tau [Eubacteriales bacterium]
MYQALYRKWRPATFADVVGQKHITDTLRAQLTAGHLSHAYLFTGTRGTGKTTCAKILARAVNCTSPKNGDPCGECAACRGIADGSILDVVEIDAASNNGVDNIRDIRDETRYTPATVSKRVYIIDEVHMLSQGAFNALLKTLEEPPSHVLFILATTEINKVPATILSRCQRFDFRRIAPRDIQRRLQEIAEAERIPLTDSGAAMIARMADGALRDALSLLDRTAAGAAGEIDEETVASSVGILAGDSAIDLMRSLLDNDLSAAIAMLGESYTAGRELGAVLDQLLGLIRDMLLVQTGRGDVSGMLSPAYAPKTVQQLAAEVPASRLIAYAGILQETLTRMPHAANRRIEAELCMVRLCQLQADDYDTLSGRIDALEEQVKRGVKVVAVAPPGKAASDDEDRPPLPDEMDAPPEDETASGPPTRRKQAGQAGAPRKLESGPQWMKVVQEVRGKIPMSTYAQLTFVKGVFHENTLLLICDDGFTCELCSKNEVRSAIAETAQAVTGRQLRVTVMEESQVSELSTKANPIDQIIKRAEELDIQCEVKD